MKLTSRLGSQVISMQLPFRHTCPFEHSLSQSLNPTAQVATAQAELVHEVAVALAVLGHFFPHMPQLLGSLLKLASQPLRKTLSQSVKPFRQPVMAHIELPQETVALGATPHCTLQPPQLLRSEAVFS